MSLRLAVVVTTALIAVQGVAVALPVASLPADDAASGAYQSISPTWEIRFDDARVVQGAEIHVFVSAKNLSDHDQAVTPGTFIPRMANGEGEEITNRIVYRASGDAPTEFRPTVPKDGGEVKLRFIFRPDAGTAQPRAFTLEAFGHRKLSFDLSGLRVPALAR